MIRYCTLFDHNYAPLGLSLIKSMRQWCGSFHLSVLALNQETRVILERQLPNMPNLSVNVIEDLVQRPVIAMRDTLPNNYFCWSLNAIYCEYLMQHYGDPVLSLDADQFFFSSIDPVVERLTNCSAAAPPHNFPPKLQHTAVARGKFNVGGVFFNNDTLGRQLCKWWADRVCERCDETTYGDQSYWNTIEQMAGGRFWNIQTGFDAGPWSTQYRYSISNGHIVMTAVDNSEDAHALINYHFHEFTPNGLGELRTVFQYDRDGECIIASNGSRRIVWKSPETGRMFGLSNYDLGRDIIVAVYLPYVRTVDQTISELIQ